MNIFEKALSKLSDADRLQALDHMRILGTCLIRLDWHKDLGEDSAKATIFHPTDVMFIHKSRTKNSNSDMAAHCQQEGDSPWSE